MLPGRGGGGEAGFVDPADDDGAFFGGAHAGGWAGEWAGEPNPPGTFEVSARARVVLSSLTPEQTVRVDRRRTRTSRVREHERSARRSSAAPRPSATHANRVTRRRTRPHANHPAKRTRWHASFSPSLSLSLPLSPPSLSLLLALEDERVPPDDPQGCVPQIATRVV